MTRIQIELTEKPKLEDEAFVMAHTRAHNAAFTPNDFRKMCVFIRNADGELIGGLTGTTYWQYLDIAFLWVSQVHRQQGYASKLVAAAETEALARGCTHALVDTFSFQARGFYEKQGFQVFGCLPGFCGKHERYYMHKSLITTQKAP